MNLKLCSFSCALTLSLGGLSLTTTAIADEAQFASARSASEYAGPERTQAAIGHYSRARTLLVEAMREFEAGRQIARPDLVLNAETWKAGVTARAEELGHIIAPQARETSGGVRFPESPSTLKQDFDKPAKTVSSAPRPRKVAKVAKQKEDKFLVAAEKKDESVARARMTAEKPMLQPVEETKAAPLEPVEIPKSQPLSDEGGKSSAKKAENAKPELSDFLEGDKTAPKSAPSAEKVSGAADPELERAVGAELSRVMGETKEKVVEASTDKEEVDSSKSLDDEEIRARLKKLSEEIAAEEKSKD